MNGNQLLRLIPNLLTLGNLACGFFGIVYVFENLYETFWQGVYFIFLAVVFDFFDGFAARLLKVSSLMGKELDSIADMVSFGVFPGVLVYALLKNLALTSFADTGIYWVVLIPLCAGYRLAKFNIDTRQSDRFIGLPTPANTLFWSGIALMYGDMSRALEIFFSQKLILFGLFVFSYLMVAELPLFALKFKGFSWKKNELQYLFILFSISLLIAFYYSIHWSAALSLIIVVYIILSLVLHLLEKK